MADAAPATPVPTLESLPVEILLKVASYVSEHVLAAILARVSRLMYAVSRSEIVWTEIIVTPCSVDELLAIASHHPEITRLDLYKLPEPQGPFPFTRVAAALPNLTAVYQTSWLKEWPLILGSDSTAGNNHNDDHNDDATRHERSADDDNNNNTEPALQGGTSGCSSSGPVQHFPFVEAARSECLELGGECVRMALLSSAVKPRCIAALRTCTNITHLDVDELDDIARAKVVFPNLTWLMAVISSLHHLIDFVNDHPRLRTLEGCMIDVDPFTPVDTAVRDLDHVEVLVLPDVGVWPHFLPALANNAVLREVNGDWCVAYAQVLCDFRGSLKVVGCDPSSRNQLSPEEKSEMAELLRRFAEESVVEHLSGYVGSDYYSSPLYKTLGSGLQYVTRLDGYWASDADFLEALGDRLSRVTRVYVTYEIDDRATACYTTHLPQLRSAMFGGTVVHGSKLACCLGRVVEFHISDDNSPETVELCAAAARAGTCRSFRTGTVEMAEAFFIHLPGGHSLRSVNLVMENWSTKAVTPLSESLVAAIVGFFERGGSVGSFVLPAPCQAQLPRGLYPWIHGR